MLENINDYALEDLKKFKKQVDQAINTYKSRAMANARKELEKTAKSLGFSLSEIVAIAPVKSKVAAKYANPEDPSQTRTVHLSIGLNPDTNTIFNENCVKSSSCF